MPAVFTIAALLLIGMAGCGGKEESPPPPAPDALPPGVPAIIDVRSAEEFATGHIDGALLMPYAQIGDMIEAKVPDKSAKIYLYCVRGWRSEMAFKTIEKKGYTNAVNLGSISDAASKLELKIVQSP